MHYNGMSFSSNSEPVITYINTMVCIRMLLSYSAPVAWVRSCSPTANCARFTRLSAKAAKCGGLTCLVTTQLSATLESSYWEYMYRTLCEWLLNVKHGICPTHWLWQVNSWKMTQHVNLHSSLVSGRAENEALLLSDINFGIFLHVNEIWNCSKTLAPITYNGVLRNIPLLVIIVEIVFIHHISRLNIIVRTLFFNLHITSN